MRCFFQEIIEILENETKQEFKSVRALFVIVVSSGDKNGIYGTTGRKIEYKEITNKFEKVSGLKDIPKIFILDFYDNGKLTSYQGSTSMPFSPVGNKKSNIKTLCFNKKKSFRKS